MAVSCQKATYATPQAVQSPMKQLNEGGFIEQQYASTDRRKRCLFITRAGAALVTLSKRQYNRLAEAFDLSGSERSQGTSSRPGTHADRRGSTIYRKAVDLA